MIGSIKELSHTVSQLVQLQQQTASGSSTVSHSPSLGPSASQVGWAPGTQPLTQARREQFQEQRRPPQSFGVSLSMGAIAMQYSAPAMRGVHAARTVVTFEQEPLRLHRGQEEARMYQPTVDPLGQRCQPVPPPCLRTTVTTRASAQGQHARFDMSAAGPSGSATEPPSARRAQEPAPTAHPGRTTAPGRQPTWQTARITQH